MANNNNINDNSYNDDNINNKKRLIIINTIMIIIIIIIIVNILIIGILSIQARIDTFLLNMISIKLLGAVQHVIQDLFSRQVILRVRRGSHWEFFHQTVSMILFSIFQLLYIRSLLKMLDFDWVL